MTNEQAKEAIAATGLSAAAQAGEVEGVRAILETVPALIEALNALSPKPGEETPQRLAARGRHLPVLKLFLERGVQPDLFTACALNMTAMVDVYLKANPKEVDAKGANGVQLMVHANDASMVALLLEHGADPTLALSQLTWSGKVELMQVAIDKGAKIDHPPEGRRPLHIACARGHKDAVILLLKLGADVHSRSKGADWERKTPLGLALMGNHTEVVEIIKKRISEVPPPPRQALPRPSGPLGRGAFRGPPRR